MHFRLICSDVSSCVLQSSWDEITACVSPALCIVAVHSIPRGCHSIYFWAKKTYQYASPLTYFNVTWQQSFSQLLALYVLSPKMPKMRVDLMKIIKHNFLFTLTSQLSHGRQGLVANSQLKWRNGMRAWKWVNFFQKLEWINRLSLQPLKKCLLIEGLAFFEDHCCFSKQGYGSGQLRKDMVKTA